MSSTDERCIAAQKEGYAEGERFDPVANELKDGLATAIRAQVSLGRFPLQDIRWCFWALGFMNACANKLKAKLETQS